MVNDPKDLRCNRQLHNLPEQPVAVAVVSEDCRDGLVHALRRASLRVGSKVKHRAGRMMLPLLPWPGSRVSRGYNLRNWVIKRQASSVSRLKATRALADASKLSVPAGSLSGCDDALAIESVSEYLLQGGAVISVGGEVHVEAISSIGSPWQAPVIRSTIWIMGCPSVSVGLIWYRLSWISLALGEAALLMTLLTACSLRSSSSWMIAAGQRRGSAAPVQACSGTAG